MADLKVWNLGIGGVNTNKSPLHIADGELRLAQNAETKTNEGAKGLGKRRGIGEFSNIGTALLALANINLVPAPESPPDPNTGEPQTLDDFGPAALLTMRAKAYLSAATTSVNDSTETTVSFDAESYDVGNLHDTSIDPSRFTVPTGGDGLYLVIGQAKWAADADGIRSARIYKNGTSLQGQHDTAAGTTGFTRHQVLALVSLTAADYVELKVFHSAGAALNLEGSAEDETYLTLMRLLSSVTPTLPRCQALRTSNQSISNGAATAVALDGETFDTHAMHDNSTDNSRITVPANQGGLYAMVGQYAWAAALVGPFRVSIRKNGTTDLCEVRGSGINDATQDATGTLSVLATMDPTDYIELVVTHHVVGGGAHNILGGVALDLTNLQMARVG